MKKYLFPLLFAIIIFFSIFTRFSYLDSIPSSLYYDEIDMGLQIRSFLQTGKDYRGEISPFYFRSYNTDRTPIPVIISTLFSIIFTTPEYAVRAGTAAVGVAVVILAIIFVYQATSSLTASAIAGFVFAFSPWLIHFSRVTFEAEYVLLFLFSYLILFYQWLKTKKDKYIYLSALVLGLSIYTYRTMSFLAPVLLLATPIFFYKEFFVSGFKKIFVWFAIGSVLMLPFLYATTIGSKDKTRISQISIFSDPMIPIEVLRGRELVSGNYQNPALGQQPTLWSKVFHNKAIGIIDRYKNNFLSNFSSDFLFVNGDPNGRHSAKKTGELLILDIFALMASIVFIYLNKNNKKIIFLVLLLFLGSIPSNLTLDGGTHASRLISFAGLLLVLVSFGYYQIYIALQKNIYTKLAFSSLVLIWVFLFLQFTNNYFFHFPIENAREYGYGFKQAIQKIKLLENDYQHIELTDTNDPPMPYYLFWTNVIAKDIQSYGTDFREEVLKGNYLDKIKPKSFPFVFCDPKGISSLKSDTLYMVSDKNLPMDFRSPDKDKVPQGLKVVDVIKYPNNEVAFYLISRDSKNGKEIEPLKTEKCK
jgi:4-amino-4-deoxy-L-arabinose transferase-like glycosyltransferase